MPRRPLLAGRLRRTRRNLALTVSAAFTGRVNLLSAAAGVLRVDREAVRALNAVDPAITLATLPDWARVARGQMVATIKIIPYGVPEREVARAIAALPAAALQVHSFRRDRASLILTRTPGMKQRLIDKGAETVTARAMALGLRMTPPVTVAHRVADVSAAISAAQGDLVLILGGSATSDAEDTCPSALVAAGGRLVRFGMPVDPGNLLFLGKHLGRPVVGLPGCVRSPAQNGADWVLERLAAGLEVTAGDIAEMGVGGLLKEIPVRPQPRGGPPGEEAERPRVAAILLAAGASRRMQGRDKLLEDVAGRPALRHAAETALASRADQVLVVLPPDLAARRAVLEGAAVEIVEAPDWAEGMAASLRAGLAAVGPGVDAAVILLADMPEVDAAAIDRLIAAFDPAEGREIVRATSQDGTPGHPVLFGRRFFEPLASLTGDRGARSVIEAASEFVTLVPTIGRAALIDLDTPEDWDSWRAGR